MRNQPGLYLDLDLDGASAAQARAVLAAAIGAGTVESVRIRTSPSIPDAAVREIIQAAKDHGAAVLIDADVDRARKLGADGVHIPWGKSVLAQLKDARRQSISGMLVGADAGRSRHDAMELGDAGADYVAFGIPMHVEDRDRARERQVELVSWWSEIFEIPCVAFDVDDADQAHKLADAGADFIAVRVNATENAHSLSERLSTFGTPAIAGEPVP